MSVAVRVENPELTESSLKAGNLLSVPIPGLGRETQWAVSRNLLDEGICNYTLLFALVFM
jgi:hypothetical protein